MYDAECSDGDICTQVHGNPEEGRTYTADTQGRDKAPWRRRHNKIFKK